MSSPESTGGDSLAFKSDSYHILDAMPDRVVVYDREWRFTYRNRRALEGMRLAAEDASGRVLWDLFPYLRGTAFEQELRRAMEERVAVQFEFQSPATRRWYDNSAYPAGTGLVHSCRDITARREDTRALQRSAERFEHAVHLSPFGIVLWDRANRITDANDAYLEITGLTREKLRDTPTIWDEITPGEYLELEREKTAELFRTGHMTPYEKEYARPDGTRVPVLVAGACLLPEADEAVSYVVDISDRKQAEETLRKREEESRTLLAALPDIICRFDRDLRFRYASPAIARATGAPPEYFLGRTHQEAGIPEELSAFLNNSLRKILATGQPDEIDFDFHSPLLGQRHLYGIGVPEFDATGAAVSVLTIVRDVTEQKRAIDALRESEERFRGMVQAASEGIWIVDTESRTTFVNQRMTELLGRPAEAILGHSCFDFIHPEDAARGRAGFEGRKSGEDSSREYRFLRGDGSLLWLEFTASRMCDAQGQVVGVVAMCTDVTQRRSADEALRASEERYRSVVEATTSVVWTTDASGAFVMPQPSWERYTGQPWKEHRGFGWSEMLHPDDRAGLLAGWAEAKASLRTYHSAARIWHAPTGEYRHFTVRSVPIKNADGSIREWVGVIEDVHERRLAEDALRESNEALQQANAALEQFAYAAAHDLQEPVRTVSLYTQLLATRYRRRLDQEANEIIGTTVESARRMQSLIEDLLAYTRAVDDGDAGPEECEPNEVLEEVVQDLGAAIETSQAEVGWDLLPRVKVRRGPLAQLFQNLLANALKYRSGEPPQVRIAARAARADEGQGWVFTVRDNGMGIPPEHHERIFRVFKRLHGQEIPGTGIGLAICQRIVSHYGGRIWVESEEGRGSSFHFTLPGARLAD